MIRKAVSIVVSLVLIVPPSALAQQAPPERDARHRPVLPLTYTGGSGRVGLGIDQDGEVQGEARGVFGFDGRRAWVAEGWLGAGRAGGAALGYHWLSGEPGPGASVMKLLLATDQNAFGDRKGTLGFGVERRRGEFGLTYSHALTGERTVDAVVASKLVTVNGWHEGRPYRMELIINTLTELFEHPYEQGVGLRASRFHDRSLVRLRAGLDYERGKAMLAGDQASQFMASLGVEKYIRGSGHSIALDVAQARKDGPFDSRRNDTRAAMLWRYEFGRPYRAPSVAVPVVAPDEATAGSRQKLVHNQMELSGEALFALDRAVLTDAAKANLRFLVERLKMSLEGTVEIVGHTCDLGSVAYNQALSEARAAALREWLVAEGVSADVLLASGQGELAPLVANDSEANRARNRRVELRFTTIEETVVDVPVETSPPLPPVVAPPEDAWIDRALRNLPAHKRVVDTYRIERVTTTVLPGSMEYLNRAPVAADDVASTMQDTAVDIVVLDNDEDPDGDALALAAVGSPGNGTASIVGDAIRYVPDAGFTGTDSFTYTVEDGNDGSDTATVTVTVAIVPNRAPVASDDVAATLQGTAVDIAVLDNDQDPDGDALALATVGSPGNGTASIVDDRIHYLPNPDFTGIDSFTYTVEDGQGGSDAAMVTVTVSAVDVPNAPPVAADDAASMLQDTTIDIDVLANDSDPDGDALTVASVGSPTHGSATIAGGSIRYTPNAGFTGTDSFTYTVEDGHGGSDTATVTVTVNAVEVPNAPPVATDDMDSMLQDTTIDIDVLANDSDPDGDALTLVAVGIPSSGTATIVGGQVRYTPNPGFIGTDSFTYTLEDDRGGSGTATVRVNVNAIDAPDNNAPVAQDDMDSMLQDTTIDIDVLANDSDPDGDALTLVAVGTPSSGTATIVGGQVRYVPNPGFIGTDSFTYTVEDDRGGSDTAMVTVNVNAIDTPDNNAPMAQDDTITTLRDVAVDVDVLANDSDPDGDTLTLSEASSPGNGTTTILGGQVRYTPNVGFVGFDGFTYMVEDGRGGSDVANVVVTVEPVGVPIAGDDFAETLVGTPIDIAVLDNDSDPDGDPLIIAQFSQPASGIATVQHVGGWVLRYDPGTTGYFGADTFTYTTSDLQGGTAIATVTVTVHPIIE